jgi:hypothetical protein
MQNQCSRNYKRAKLSDMACVLCASEDDPTDEDVIPRWLLRAFNVEFGSTTINVGEEGGDKHQVRALRHFQVTLDGGLCRKCNNERLSGLEQLVQPILEPMAVRCQPTTLDLASQRLLAVWAIKTIYLLELASRQQYPGARAIEGYVPSNAEVGWLLAQLEQHPARLVEPPPRSMVWLASWDCMTPGSVNKGAMLTYAPSTAQVRTPGGGQVNGQFTTLAIGYAAFQVFTVDFVEAKRREAEVWNTHPPPSIVGQVPIIWPHRLYAGDVAWPPPAFPNDSFDRLTNWDGALRRGHEG